MRLTYGSGTWQPSEIVYWMITKGGVTSPVDCCRIHQNFAALVHGRDGEFVDVTNMVPTSHVPSKACDYRLPKSVVTALKELEIKCNDWYTSTSDDG
ncbi:hypothetical protein V6N13_065082 [Hibiscus sabdariffa]